MSPWVMVGVSMYQERTPLDFLKSICNILDEPIKEVLGHSRKRDLVEARQIAFYIAVNNIKKVTLERIGKELGGKNHATVIHGVNKINNLKGYDDVIKEKLKLIEKNRPLWKVN